MKDEEVLYVLRRPDGTIRAELPMTAAFAEKINASRKKRGFNDGNWVPQDKQEYGLWHLEPAIPDWMLALLQKARHRPIEGEETDSELPFIGMYQSEEDPWMQ